MGLFDPYKTLIRPLLFRVDPERAHSLAIRILPLLPEAAKPGGIPLSTELFGCSFPNPIGLAAGFDKDGSRLQHLHRLGFGFAEVGTVTPSPQRGNPKPRLFRLKAERGLINRMGFNNKGGEALRSVLEKLPPPGRRRLPVGVNIGKQRETPPHRAIDDYGRLIELLLPMADYIVINVSSPNTPDLRLLEEAETLSGLLASIRKIADRAAGKSGVKCPPLLAKLSPDLTSNRLEASVATIAANGLDGAILTNTTVDRSAVGPDAPADGGLSGEPLRPLSLEAVRVARKATSGGLPLIGVGGISTPEDVYERIRAGASLVQVYTGLIYHGPRFVPRLLAGLADLLQQDGFTKICEAIGTENS